MSLINTYVDGSYNVLCKVICYVISKYSAYNCDDVEDAIRLLKDDGKIYSNKIYTTNDDGSVVCTRQPYKDNARNIITSWDYVHDSYGKDVTDLVLRFSTIDKHFNYTDVTPCDIISYYETSFTFVDDEDRKWVVEYNEPILSVLKQS